VHCASLSFPRTLTRPSPPPDNHALSCYEIMAQPYSLNPGQCGHTFCALCILRHFFSRLHKACGGWHESVDCPMCRSLLVITPDRVPRLGRSP
jgi:hypothetical protein